MQGTVDEEGQMYFQLLGSDKILMEVDYTINMVNYKTINTSPVHSTSLSSIPEHSSLSGTPEHSSSRGAPEHSSLRSACNEHSL